MSVHDYVGDRSVVRVRRGSLPRCLMAATRLLAAAPGADAQGICPATEVASGLQAPLGITQSPLVRKTMYGPKFSIPLERTPP
jgi:hypothetical protein